MEYETDFAQSFMRRTLALLRDYVGPYDATLLANCLLGLLVVPKETYLDRLPADPPARFSAWGLPESSIKRYGRKTKVNPNPATLRGVVYNLRNSIAHFALTPIQEKGGDVVAFHFQDTIAGFHAEVSVDHMRVLVRRIAEHLGVEAAV